MTEMVKTSELAEELRPALVGFIKSLGYTEEQGETFANAYLEKVEKMPILAKLRALTYQDTYCMSAGFAAAGIDEQEAFERFEALPDDGSEEEDVD